MSKFGVNIDLSIFFEDERKMVFIMVDPKWENVECLQERVQYLFEVDSVRFINSDGSFLPPQEPIEIIKFCKGLKAFVPKESLDKRKIKKSKKIQQIEKSSQGSDSEETRNLICNEEASNNESQKKRKYYSLGSGFSASSTPNQAKRIKNISLHNDKLKQINKSSEISSTSEQMPPPPSITTLSPAASNKSKVKKSKSSSATTGYEKPSVGNISNPCEISHECITKIDENTSNNSVNNKKRHSPTTKENEISDIVQNVEITFNDALKARPSSVPSSTFINESKMMPPNQKSTQSLQSPNSKNPFKRQSSNNSKGHIYFNESGEMVITSSKNTQKNDKENKKPQTRTIFRCLLNDVSSNGLPKPRIFTAKPIAKDPITKQVVEIQEEIILLPKKADTNSNKCQNLETTQCKETDTSAMQTSQTLQNTETDLLHTEDQERNSLNDTKNTESSTIDNDIKQTSTENMITTKNKTSVFKNPEACMENLETTQSGVEDPVNKDDSILNQTDTKSGANQTSVLSVDSIVIDDDEDDNTKLKKQSEVSSKEQSHDLTNDDRGDDSSDIEEISEIIDLNETEDNCSSNVNTSSSSTHSFNYSKIVVHKILPFCTDMLELPNIGDIIVFKVPYINKYQKKAETNFMAGKVEYINKRMKSIKILIIDGLIELANIPSKFLCNLDDSQDQIKHLQLKLNEMSEPKIFS